MVPRNEWPGLVMREIGYAANHTGAFSMAARGSGSAKGFCHMLPWPVNCLAKALASPSIDSSTSHWTYSGLSPEAGPLPGLRRCHGHIRSRARGRSRAGRAG